MSEINDISNMDYIYLLKSVSDDANIIRDTIKLATDYQVMANTIEAASNVTSNTVTPDLSNAFSYSVEDVSNIENTTESYIV
jgi:hypothetical protein